MRKLTEFSVRYPITILMLVLAILLLGYISFQRLGMDLFPDLNNPRLFIEVKSGELPPEEMEQQFVEGIESMAIRQKQVIEVASVSNIGNAQVTVEYTWDADMDEAFLDLQKSLTAYSQNLEVDELTISQHDPNAEPILLLGFSHPQIEDMDELRKVAENYLRNEITRLDGIAAVEIIGAEEKEVSIETEPYILEAYGLNLSTLANRIQSYNRNSTAGSIVEMGKRYIIKGLGEFTSIDDVANVIVAQKQETNQAGQATGATVPVYLRDVAEISYLNKDPDNIVRINGKRSLSLAIYKETKFNTVRAVEHLNDALGELKKGLPGYELRVVSDQSTFIVGAVNEVEESALIGIILAVIILYVFLRRIGTTAIISIAIPISVVATFNLMYFNGLTLNIMTLGGLALGAGMLVDNAIVVMENIFRNLEQGVSLHEAAITGAAEVGGAITASTITTIVVFLPIVYLHGAAGELFREQAWTVAFSLISSLVVAILVIPMLSSRLLKSKSKTPKSSPLQFVAYGRFLEKLLLRRRRVIAIAFALIVITIILVPFIGSEFIPKTDSRDFRLEIKLPDGTALSRTEQVAIGIENLLKESLASDVELLYSQIGPSGNDLSESAGFIEGDNTAVLSVYFKKELQKPVEQYVKSVEYALSQIPDLEFNLVRGQSALQSTLGTDEKPVIIEIRGESLDILSELSKEIVSQMKLVPDLIHLESGFEKGRRQVDVVIDRMRAGINNIGIETVAATLADYLEGHEAGNWDSEGELRDLTLHLSKPALKDLSNLYIDNGQRKVRLDEIARINFSDAPREIQRRNQVRIGTITADIGSGLALDKVVNKIEQKMMQVNFSPNYSYQITGEEQKRSDAFGSLKFALILSVILIYMVLASQFESLIHPFTILLTIPLAAVGAILIFFALGMPLNIMAYIGIIMLVGIAVNDSIILVDAINQLKRGGLDLSAAIVEAGKRRIRPIIMTSLTTILALLPLTFGFGEGAALRAPMALAVIGGLLTSTLLTLVVIPCVYYVFDRLRD